jgi:hypothetical protein
MSYFGFSPDLVKIFMLALVSYFMTSSKSCLYWTRYSTLVDPRARTRTCFSCSPQLHSPLSPHVSSLSLVLICHAINRISTKELHGIKKSISPQCGALVLFFFSLPLLLGMITSPIYAFGLVDFPRMSFCSYLFDTRFS